MKAFQKAILSLTLAAAMAASLAGCGGSPTSPPSDSSPGGASGGAAPQTLKCLGSESLNKFIHFADRDNYKVWQELDAQFQAAGLNLEFELVPPDQYPVVIQTRMASGSGLPDFANISSLDATTSLNLAKQGTLLPVNQIIDQYSAGSAKEFFTGKGAVAAKATTAADGNRYWVTNFQTTTYQGKPASTCTIINIRKDWLDQLGLPVPTTAQEFEDTMKAFREKDANKNGQADEVLAFDPSTFNSGIAQWFGLVPTSAEPVGIDTANGKVFSPWYQPGVKEYFQYLNGLLNEGILEPSLIGAASSEQQDQMNAENKVGAIYTYALQTWLEPAVNAENAEYLPIGPLPALDGITPRNSIEPPKLAWNKWAFTKHCSDWASAAKLLDILYTDNYEQLSNWGIEGDTFELVDGQKQYLPNIDNSHWEECAKNGAIQGNWMWGDAMFPKLRYARMEDEITPLETKAPYKAQYQKDVIFYEPASPNDPGSYMALPSEEQLARKGEILTDLNTYSKELATQLILGRKSLDDWDSYMADLKSLGLDELIAINQDMLDRFNA